MRCRERAARYGMMRAIRECVEGINEAKKVGGKRGNSQKERVFGIRYFGGREGIIGGQAYE